MFPTVPQLVLSVILGNTLTNFMRASAGTREETPNKVGHIMNAAELIGLLADDDDDDDDDVGAIGYDLIGQDDDDDDDDDAVLEALSVSGMGNSELIGAVRKVKKAKARKRAKSRASKALARIASKNSGAVIQRDMNRRRRYPLGIVPTAVTTTGTVPAAPQNLFRPERCVIPSDVAFDFGVSDIKVGNSSQFVQNVEVPAALFSEVAINTGVYFDTAEVGNQMSVSVRCKTGVATEFSGAFVGSIAK